MYNIGALRADAARGAFFEKTAPLDPLEKLFIYAEEIFRLAGIHPEDRPYLHERELPGMPLERNWKQIVTRVILMISLLIITILVLKHFLE